MSHPTLRFQDEGFQKLDQAVGRSLAIEEVGQFVMGPDKSLIIAIDAFENTWFDVVDAALGRLYPTVHEKVLQNLRKTSGVMVVINVKTLQRIADLIMGISTPSRHDVAADTPADPGVNPTPVAP